MIRWWRNLPDVPVYDWPLTDKRDILVSFTVESRKTGEIIYEWSRYSDE